MNFKAELETMRSL